MNQTPHHITMSCPETAGSDQPTVPAQPDLAALARADALRPVFHFVSPGGWLNDPNGVGWRDGLFHLFYQYNPRGAFHHKIHWGHAVSTDLFHWEDRPIALTPGDGPDQDGCWSGVLVDSPEGPALVYSGRTGAHELPCVAFGSEDLDIWWPQPLPIIDSAPADFRVTAFRDHCVWFEGGVWRQLVGSGVEGRGGCAFMYESSDFTQWRELGPMVIGDVAEADAENPEWTGTMWECIDFFRMLPGDEGVTGAPEGRSGWPHVLIFSAWHEHRTLHSMAAIGAYDGQIFTPHSVQRLDFGGRHAYAPQTFIDGEGRRILWAWMQEGRPEAAQLSSGWSGAMTLPRRLWLNDDLQLCAEPVSELRRLRGQEISVNDTATDGHTVCRGQVMDIELSLEVPQGGSVCMEVLSTEPGAVGEGERTRITFQRDSTHQVLLSVDRSESSLDPGCDSSEHSGHVPHYEGRPLPVRVVLDRSSLEVFVEGVSLTTRIYPTRDDAQHVTLRRTGDAAVESLKAWQLSPTEQPDRSMYPEPAD